MTRMLLAVALLACSSCLAVAADAEQTTIVLLGATGNLAGKYLWEIFFDLHTIGQLGPNPKVIGAATKAPDVGVDKINSFIDALCDKKNLVPAQEGQCASDLAAFKSVVEYKQLRREEQYEALGAELTSDLKAKGLVEAGRMWYLSVSPDFYPDITDFINRHGRPSADSWMRVIVEKPFGRDYESAVALAETLSKNLQEPEIYRVDHYMGKDGVQVIEGFRRANPALEDAYNSNNVAYIEAVMKETEECDGRTGFYDNYGVVRDVLQNHLTEMVALAGMDVPAIGASAEARTAFLQRMQPADVQQGRYGQYERYNTHVEEDSGAEEGSLSVSTPTAAAVPLYSTSSRWAGMPFIAAAGKSMDKREAYLRVMLKQEKSDGSPCEVRFNVQGAPLGTAVTVCSNLKEVNAPAGWEEAEKTDGGDTVFRPTGTSYNAYRVLVEEAVNGNRANFMGTEELLASWKMWTPLLHEYEEEIASPLHYAAGDAEFSGTPLQPWNVIDITHLHTHEEL